MLSGSCRMLPVLSEVHFLHVSSETGCGFVGGGMVGMFSHIAVSSIDESREEAGEPLFCV